MGKKIGTLISISPYFYKFIIMLSIIYIKISKILN